MDIHIYHGENHMILTDELTDQMKQWMASGIATLETDAPSNSVLNQFLHRLTGSSTNIGIWVYEDVAALKEIVWKHYLIVKAAGGLVKNDQGEYLFMFRRGHWDLPKGKLDDGESLEECAVREVKEETGLSHVNLGTYLGATYHCYHEYGKPNLKETYWYAMEAPGQQKLIPQVQEDITALKWIDKNGLTEVLRKTYPSIKTVIADYID